VSVAFADELIAHRLDSKKEELLCVPSLINPPDEFCGDGVINQGGIEDCDGDSLLCSAQEICHETCKCLPTQRRCGNGVIEPPHGEECEANGDCGAGDACTSSCTCMDFQCPDTLERTRAASGSNYDSGYSGIAHNNSPAAHAVTHLRLSEVSGTGPGSCGVATIAGLDPSTGLCRCADDNRQTCDQPFELDLDDCGGERCTCYLDPPAPAVSGAVPTCNITPYTADVFGSWNVDTGAGTVILPSEQTAYFALGGTTVKPCPTCDGDPIRNDGVRGGTCSGGLDAGQACDAQGRDDTWPVPGGGEYSLDCFPGGAFITSELFIDHALTTGSATLDIGLPCGSPEEPKLCHCGRCDGDTSQECTSNADCGADGPCAKIGNDIPLPNKCTGGACTDLGQGQGECLAGPVGMFCDAVLRADGRGLFSCQNDALCISLSAGTCTFTQNRTCMPDMISMTGTVSTTDPFLVSAVCTSPSDTNPAANPVAGYPGPGVRQEQHSTVFTCAGDPGSTYPSCPAAP
jgi:hypothetical protein